MIDSEGDEGEFAEGWGDYEQTQQTYCEEQQPTKSALQLYEQSIRSAALFCDIDNIRQQVLRFHKILLTTSGVNSMKIEFFKRQYKPAIKKTQFYETHCVYSVVLAQFSLEITVLNVHRSSDDKDESVKTDEVGSGGFGTVRVVRVGKEEFAVKRINFLVRRQIMDEFDVETERAQKDQICRAIQEYSLYKICSMLGVGPEVLFHDSYDLVCYNNCIEFVMELCEPIRKNSNIPLERLETDLFNCMRTLHSARLVHRDIKPDNILYSPSRRRFVFADFGLAHPVLEDYMQKTKSKFAGTTEFASEEMLALIGGQFGQVNLYLNDFHSLRLSLSKIATLNSHSTSMKRNSMSFNEQYTSFGADQCEIEEYGQQYSQPFSSCESLVSSNSIYRLQLARVQAPNRFASQINFYESRVLFKVFHVLEVELIISGQNLKNIFEEICIEFQDEFMRGLLWRYICQALPTKINQNSQLTLLLRGLKNTARHYGPNSEKAATYVQKIIQQIDTTKQVCYVLQFQQLKRKLIMGVQIQSENSRETLTINYRLRNFDYLIQLCINELKRMAFLKKNTPQTFNMRKKIRLQFMCEVYIMTKLIDSLTEQQSGVINDLFLQIWDEGQIVQTKKKIAQLLESHKINSFKQMKELKLIKKVTGIIMQFILQTFRAWNYKNIFMFMKIMDFFIFSFYLTNINRFKVKQFFEIIQQLYTYKIKEGISDKTELCSVKLALLTTYCRMYKYNQDILPKAQLILQQIKEIDTQKKNFYITALNLINSVLIDNAEYLQVLSQYNQCLQDLHQSSHLLQFQKNILKIDIFKSLGKIYIQKKQYEAGLKHLQISRLIILQNFGIHNYFKHYYECSNNIAHCFYLKGQKQRALTQYEKLADLFQQKQKSTKDELTLIYRAIITIKLQKGDINEQEIRVLIKKIVEATVATMHNSSIFSLKMSHLDMRCFYFVYDIVNPKIQISVLKAINNNIKYYMPYFQQVEKVINKKLYILYNEARLPLKALVHMEYYIRSKMNSISQCQQEDFRVMIFFSKRLFELKLARKALLFMNRFLFYIPLTFLEAREKSITLYHRIMCQLKNPWKAVTTELIKFNCQAYSKRDFQQIKQQGIFNGNFKWEKLLDKWMQML